jgi:hypothetical protein
MLEARNLIQPMLNDSIIGAKESTRNLDPIVDHCSEGQEGASRHRSRSVRGEEKLAFARVALHTNGIAKLVIAEKEGMHAYVLGLPFIVCFSGEEAGHVIGQGTNDVRRKFLVEGVVDKVM